MFKAVIFDMDGVMVDTELVQSNAFEAVLAEYGVTAEKNGHGTVHVSGATTDETWEMFKERYNFDAPTELLTRKKRDATMAVLNNSVEPMPGLIELLNELKSHDVKLAVATSAQQERAELVLSKLDIRKFFSVVISANDIEHGKPAPDPYLKAAEHLQIAPSECVVLEDAEVGVLSGKAAGMKVIAIPNEHTKRMNFDKADAIVDSLSIISYDSLTKLFLK